MVSKHRSKQADLRLCIAAHLNGHPERYLDRGLSTPKQACRDPKIFSRGTPTSRALVPQIADFDGESLRRCLPRIVLAIAGALSAGGHVYVHCTAGLGRAPAACIAWRYWFDGMQLDEVSGSSCSSLSPSSWAYTLQRFSTACEAQQGKCCLLCQIKCDCARSFEK